MTGSQWVKKMRHDELVTGASRATVMSLDFKCRGFTKQSDASLFKSKEDCSGFHVENRLMWGKCKSGEPREKAVAVIHSGDDGSLEWLWQ